VIKAWIKSDRERGLQRAVMILHALALNGHNRMDPKNEENKKPMAKTESGDNLNDDEVPSVFGRIARWGASLLGKGNTRINAEKKSAFALKSRSNPQSDQRSREVNDQSQHFPATGIASRLNYIHSGTQELNKGSPRETEFYAK